MKLTQERDMSEFFTVSVLIATFASGVRLATPYLLAALGETLGQRSGVLNLGVDGVMLLSSFFAYWTVLESGSRLLGVVIGILVLGSANCFFSNKLGPLDPFHHLGKQRFHFSVTFHTLEIFCLTTLSLFI